MGKRQSLSSTPSVASLRENRANPFYIYTRSFWNAISEGTFLVMPWIALLQRLGVTSHSNSEGSSTHIEWYHSGFVAWELEKPVSPVSPILCQNSWNFLVIWRFEQKQECDLIQVKKALGFAENSIECRLNRLHSVESFWKFQFLVNWRYRT